MKNFKNIIIIIIVLLYSFLLFLNNYCFAYSTSKYSIELPSNYSQTNTDSFTDSYGNNINIKISSSGDVNNFKYSHGNLEQIVNILLSELENIETLKINSVVFKDVTTFTKNNYDCFHIILEYSFLGHIFYSEQYVTMSGQEIYILTITTDDFSMFDSVNIESTVDSFTINNYKDIESDSLIKKVLMSILSVTIVIILYNIIYNKSNKNKEGKNNNGYTD